MTVLLLKLVSQLQPWVSFVITGTGSRNPGNKI